MNRLHQDELTVSISRMGSPSGISTNLAVDLDRKPPHRFFLPLHYEKNYAYPLLVWIHGPGGMEAEIGQVMPHISLRNYVGVAPRGVVKDIQASRAGQDAYTWDQSLTSVGAALDDVLDCVNLAKRRFNIANHRVFLVGNDVGGTMAMRLALTAPQEFGGVVSLGGALPTTNQPLAGIEQARSLPIMMAHCRDSQTFDTEAMCHNLKLLHSAGMKVCLRQYPCDQEVTTKMLSDVNAWIMEQVVGTASFTEIDDPTHARLEDRN